MKLVHNIQQLIDRRRELRKNPTKEEDLLWQELRKEKLGYKFRRQHSIGGYILDFYCAPQRLIIEVDGPIHESNREYDAVRDRYFRELDYRVLRIINDEVQNRMGAVLVKIRQALEEQQLDPASPLT